MKPERIFFVFLDGVGLGNDNPEVNPLSNGHFPTLKHLGGEHNWIADRPDIHSDFLTFRAIDANLDIEGLPQSGTGQATLFTGVNCAEIAERHWGPYPHTTSFPIIRDLNIFSRLQRIGKSGIFVNAYPDRFFTYAEARSRWTVTTRCCVEAGLEIYRERDALNGRALTAEITGKAWRDQLGIAVPLYAPEDAAQVLLSHDADLILFEYYLTDKAGHAQNMQRASDVLSDVNGFLQGLTKHMDLERDLLIVTSDHGNLEDLSVKSHTTNRVPFVAYGTGASVFADVQALTDVVPGIVDVLTR